MSTDSKRQVVKQIKQRKYLNKDFSGFKQDLLEYARVHFPDRIKDFSETGLGGLFLEMAAYVGDVQSFYLDHQFHELDPNSSVEVRNIERHLRNSGVEVVGASPAVVMVTISLEVPADPNYSPPVPLASAIPVIGAGTIFPSNGGAAFELVDDLDFSEKVNDQYVAGIRISSKDPNNNPTAFIM